MLGHHGGDQQNPDDARGEEARPDQPPREGGFWLLHRETWNRRETPPDRAQLLHAYFSSISSACSSHFELILANPCGIYL